MQNKNLINAFARKSNAKAVAAESFVGSRSATAFFMHWFLKKGNKMFKGIFANTETSDLKLNLEQFRKFKISITMLKKIKADVTLKDLIDTFNLLTSEQMLDAIDMVERSLTFTGRLMSYEIVRRDAEVKAPDAEW